MRFKGKLTMAEIEIIRAGHREGRSTAEVASEIGCVRRTIRKYYERFNHGEDYRPKMWSGRSRSEKKPRAEPRLPAPPREDRFYHCNFEPS